MPGGRTAADAMCPHCLLAKFSEVPGRRAQLSRQRARPVRPGEAPQDTPRHQGVQDAGRIPRQEAPRVRRARRGARRRPPRRSGPGRVHGMARQRRAGLSLFVVLPRAPPTSSPPAERLPRGRPAVLRKIKGAPPSLAGAGAFCAPPQRRTAWGMAACGRPPRSRRTDPPAPRSAGAPRSALRPPGPKTRDPLR